MTGPSPEPDFPVSSCVPCGRDVLTHVVLDDAGNEERRCLHCDAALDPSAVRWVLAAELDTLGYDVGDGEGCGRPGCGKGNCATRA